MSLSENAPARRRRRGFTLIELMIVIAIIAILAGILIPNFMHARDESQTSACEGNLKQLAAALEEYAVDNAGNYPATGVMTAGFMPVTYIANYPLDPVNASLYNFTNGATADCPAAAGTKSYEIIDNGGHNAAVKIDNAPAGAKTIFYCSGAGISGK